MIIRIILIILATNLLSQAQNDSSYLDYDQLTWLDINQAVKSNLSTTVISGSRTEKDLNDLPFTIFVITAQEIKENGYLTLTDALKHLPGIRVSQPGSALEGETFLMRGLLGNSYAKILVNDVPIKPFVVKGMPIGAQLPISQAERIEVIYGPAATLYGADASAGIINIILKKNEYPTHAQANIEIGENGHTRLDVLYGGKLGLNKKVLNLMVYGSFTSFNDREIKYDLDSLYNPSVYEGFYGFNSSEDVDYEDRSNFIGTTGEPRMENLPHVSNMVGIDLRLGSLQLTGHRFFRRDHSSLGLSPYAVSYAIPISSFGETIYSASLLYRKKFNKWGFSTRLSYLDYQTEAISSYSYVIPAFGALLYSFFPDDPIEPEEREEIYTSIDDQYFSDNRFSSSKSREGFVETLINFKLNKNISVSSGISLQGGIGDPIESYKRTPFTSGFIPVFDPDRFGVEEASYSEISAFAEANVTLNKFNIIVGGQVLRRDDDYLLKNSAILNPRVGLLYKPNTKLSIRSSFSRAFRYPSPYFTSSTFAVNASDLTSIETGSPDLTPESTLNYELGIRFMPKSTIHLDASLYYTRTTDFVNYSLSIGEQRKIISIGYFNEEESFAELLGIQSRLIANNIIPAIGLDVTLNLGYAVGNERVRAITLTELASLTDIPDLRSQPRLIGQMRFAFDVFKNVKFTMDHILMSKSFTRNIFRVPSDLLGVNTTESVLRNKGYYIVDMRLLYTINNKLSALLNISNILNGQYAGIDATSDPDALLYNPQPLRMIRVGVNFQLN